MTASLFKLIHLFYHKKVFFAIGRQGKTVNFEHGLVAEEIEKTPNIGSAFFI